MSPVSYEVINTSTIKLWLKTQVISCCQVGCGRWRNTCLFNLLPRNSEFIIFRQFLIRDGQNANTWSTFEQHIPLQSLQIIEVNQSLSKRSLPSALQLQAKSLRHFSFIHRLSRKATNPNSRTNVTNVTNITYVGLQYVGYIQTLHKMISQSCVIFLSLVTWKDHGKLSGSSLKRSDKGAKACRGRRRPKDLFPPKERGVPVPSATVP